MKGYHEYEDLFESLSVDLTKNNDKEYYYVYLPEIDAIAHEKGNCSEEFKEAMEKLLKHMDKFYEKDIFELSFIGVHGGASKNEMEIPLLFYRF
ncbi:hypothetical protein [Clostridium tagluense]|uniref:hypothetical protein n=1 Tax=Clostridium tagluense TaxID=360422 RepID=UPI001CF2DE28|nr:hypothetical protein [Clostridium tagluense]MCB2310138.1 hypothetical protein [Clostridium tagluense]MCB2315220.1 hypothetical protein [Clostridium tagluense]MCB2324963.1 hypothetical protein [Clostridium tagluense]MCB2329583.1 hypothetical protein [Clostridium tagluense]WAG51648.1 hypothetical protein LL095_05170 [Clostridium tagluense]